MGKEIDPYKFIRDEEFPLEVQEAMLLHSYLPDRWEGMSGQYLGKDWSALSELLDAHDVEDKRVVIFFLKYIDMYKQKSVNDEVEKKRRKQEAKLKAPVGSNPQIKDYG